MRRNSDDDDDSSGVFDGIEQMLSGMTGGESAPVDVHQYDDEIRVVADVPGVDKDAIDLKCDGTVLTINAESPEREYHERLTLPTRVDEHSAAATYNNGILEVTFDPEEDSADIEL